MHALGGGAHKTQKKLHGSSREASPDKEGRLRTLCRFQKRVA
jgi:hypothetical protein